MGLHGFAKAANYDLIADTMRPVMDQQFNATIEIIKPNIEAGEFDRVTRTRATREATVLWTGPARIQAMRWPNVAAAKGDPASLRTVVFHLPQEADIDPEFVREGWRIRVVDGGESSYLAGGLYVITTSVNSSYAWDRRIETMMDQGA